STVNPGSGQRILLAEDNLTNQRLAVQILTTLGHSVDVVSNGIEAVEYAAKGDYDLILMDCQMPVMDGYEATAAIRGEESGRRVPVIAMTANVMKYDREKCLAAGMDDYISKPINIVSFQQVLNDWLTNSSAGVAGFSDAGDTA
ncbi:MAG: response regulator, partial [Gammaproteobacteria bacterium]|nr:response regulator [Gammaproteobacteria bacterium]